MHFSGHRRDLQEVLLIFFHSHMIEYIGHQSVSLISEIGSHLSAHPRLLRKENKLHVDIFQHSQFTICCLKFKPRRRYGGVQRDYHVEVRTVKKDILKVD